VHTQTNSLLFGVWFIVADLITDFNIAKECSTLCSVSKMRAEFILVQFSMTVLTDNHSGNWADPDLDSQKDRRPESSPAAPLPHPLQHRTGLSCGLAEEEPRGWAPHKPTASPLKKNTSPSLTHNVLEPHTPASPNPRAHAARQAHPSPTSSWGHAPQPHSPRAPAIRDNCSRHLLTVSSKSITAPPPPGPVTSAASATSGSPRRSLPAGNSSPCRWVPGLPQGSLCALLSEPKTNQ
jgi:hypothetical protein